jgi:hypothetical protein
MVPPRPPRHGSWVRGLHSWTGWVVVFCVVGGTGVRPTFLTAARRCALQTRRAEELNELGGFQQCAGPAYCFSPIPTSGTGVAGFLRKDPAVESTPSHPAVYKTSMELPDDDKVRPPTYPPPSPRLPHIGMLVAALWLGVCTQIEACVLHTRVTPVWPPSSGSA